MSSNATLVTVVIPTFNYGRYVTAAVESALAQTYPHVEVIVVDDGSTDDTRDRLAGYGDRIRYVYQPNAGLSAARNTGITQARGAFVALLDSDDQFHPRKLELQMRAFAARPALGLVGTDHFSDDPPAWADLPDATPPVRDVSLTDLVVRTRFSPSSVVARKECFEAVGLFDPSLRSVEDRDMWIRVAARFPVATVPLPLTWYRQTPGSMSRNAERMEHYERLVLERAFSLPELAGRPLLRRKAFGLAAYAAALMYREAGMLGRAFTRVLRSARLWPFPYRWSEVRAFARMRFVLLMPRFLARRL